MLDDAIITQIMRCTLREKKMKRMQQDLSN